MASSCPLNLTVYSEQYYDILILTRFIMYEQSPCAHLARYIHVVDHDNLMLTMISITSKHTLYKMIKISYKHNYNKNVPVKKVEAGSS